MKSFLTGLINKKTSKLTHHSGFTLGELTIALVVVTLVVMVTLPITLSKMKKVDYTSYYMGYNFIKDVSVNVLYKIIENTESEETEECGFEIDGVCYSKPFLPTPISKSECETLNMRDFWNGMCRSDNDYFAGAVKHCGGDIINLSRGFPFNKLLGIHDWESGFFDATTVEEYGFIADEDGVINIWQGGSSNYCAAYYIKPDSELYNTCSVSLYGSSIGERYIRRDEGSNIQAVCIIEKSDEEPANGAKSFCENVSSTYNIDESNCSVSVADVESSAASLDFSSLSPHIILSNGLNLYIGSDFDEISELSDAVDVDDRQGFIVYVDVNGKSGKGRLWDDVFPFYLLKSGKVLPAYDADLAAGANNKEYLNVNVLYDSYSSGNRAVKLLLRDSNFKNAACVTGYIKSAKYCDGKTQYDLCKKDYHDCRIIVKEPVKLF